MKLGIRKDAELERVGVDWAGEFGAVAMRLPLTCCFIIGIFRSMMSSYWQLTTPCRQLTV